ncbi:MAG: Fe-S cluster assembly protein SufD [Planctomycetales bacterium]|nr:Fe-S cluster assembly protein SufD [Planctomycetales bacterium]
MAAPVETRDLYLEEYRRRAPDLPGAGLPWLRRTREDAIERLASRGFPTTREEAWRFTDSGPASRAPFAPPPPRSGAASAAGAGPAHPGAHLTFLDGRPAPDLSALPAAPGASVATLREALDRSPAPLEPVLGRLVPAAEHPFAALNTSLFEDGALVHVQKGVVLADPVHLVFLSWRAAEPFRTLPRIVLLLEEGAAATVVVSYTGPAGGAMLTSAVTEVALGEGASLRLVKVQRESVEGFHLDATAARVARGAAFSSHVVTLGAALSRTDLTVALAGAGAECGLSGLYELRGRQHADHHTTIVHEAPQGTSRELYKGVLDGRSRAVFDGRILVRPEAQKTNALQTNKNLLLSPEALVNTKPELQIFANDVKVKHGATIGQLDRDVLFYLRSRGIPEEEARRLLIHAFASEVVDAIPVPWVRETTAAALFTTIGERPDGGRP